MMRGKSRTQLLVPYTPRADLLEVPPEPCRSSNLYFRTQPKAPRWDPHGRQESLAVKSSDFGGRQLWL